MTIMYSLLSALFAAFLYFNPASSMSPYETAEYFASYDRVVESYENVQLFESLGTEVSDKVSILDEYKQVRFLVISVNDSVTAHNDVYTDKDTINRLSDEALRDHVKWLSEWLTLQ